MTDRLRRPGPQPLPLWADWLKGAAQRVSQETLVASANLLSSSSALT
jgi:hypothetical protein